MAKSSTLSNIGSITKPLFSFQRPTTPIQNIFRKAMTAPTQSLSTSRPKYLNTHPPPCNDQQYPEISVILPSASTKQQPSPQGIIYFIEIEKCAKKPKALLRAAFIRYLSKASGGKFFQNTAFQHPFTDSGVPSPRTLPAHQHNRQSCSVTKCTSSRNNCCICFR